MSNDRQVSAVVVDTDGNVTEVEVGADLRSLQAIVGGPIEGVGPHHEDHGMWHAYCNEEGKLERLPFNHVATFIAHRLGWPSGDVLVGPVVFLGETKDGEEAALPQVTLDAIRSIMAESA